jgi:hypothetical protein
MGLYLSSWVNVQVPWESLDEDGDEIEFEDTVSLTVAVPKERY